MEKVIKDLNMIDVLSVNGNAQFCMMYDGKLIAIEGMEQRLYSDKDSKEYVSDIKIVLSTGEEVAAWDGKSYLPIYKSEEDWKASKKYEYIESRKIAYIVNCRTTKDNHVLFVDDNHRIIDFDMLDLQLLIYTERNEKGCLQTKRATTHLDSGIELTYSNTYNDLTKLTDECDWIEVDGEGKMILHDARLKKFRFSDVQISAINELKAKIGELATKYGVHLAYDSEGDGICLINGNSFDTLDCYDNEDVPEYAKNENGELAKEYDVKADVLKCSEPLSNFYIGYDTYIVGNRKEEEKESK